MSSFDTTRPCPAVAGPPLPALTAQDYPNTLMHTVLVKALTTRRPSGGKGEAEFAAWLCNRLPVTMLDTAGNIHVDLRQGPQNTTLFTAHLDTVHWSEGPNTVRVDGDTWRADPESQSCLGADDGAGVALLCHMIAEGVPAYYIFTRGEEAGGIGAKALADDMPELLQEFDRAMAFDRKGTGDVITHMMVGQVCSQEFALALAAQLGMDYKPCPYGSYTDTAEFVGIVPECTNISIGYANEHGDGESLWLPHLEALSRAVLAVAWDDLPVSRWPQGEDSCEILTDAALRCAIEDYMAEDDKYSLPMLLAENLYPDDADLALRQINTRRLTADRLTYALEQLDAGWDATWVMDEIAEEILR